jgi:hypothetical protein
MVAPAVPLFLDEAIVRLQFGPAVGGNLTSVAATDVITSAAPHGLAVGDAVRFLTLTGGTGLVVGTTYYVIAAGFGASAFEVSETPGGATVDHSTNITAGTVAKYVDFACHVSGVSVVPTPGKVVTFTPLCPDGAVSETAADTFALEFTGAQDWSPTGLARLLWDHAGETVPFEVNAYGVAAASATPSAFGNAKAVRPTYGGKADEYAPLEVSLPIVGTPTISPA